MQSSHTVFPCVCVYVYRSGMMNVTHTHTSTRFQLPRTEAGCVVPWSNASMIPSASSHGSSVHSMKEKNHLIASTTEVSDYVEFPQNVGSCCQHSIARVPLTGIHYTYTIESHTKVNCMYTLIFLNNLLASASTPCCLPQ